MEEWMDKKTAKGIRDEEKVKERRNESTHTPVACYLITAVLACHARLTGPLRSALAPL